jgi:hypothetical protein
MWDATAKELRGAAAQKWVKKVKLALAQERPGDAQLQNDLLWIELEEHLS